MDVRDIADNVKRAKPLKRLTNMEILVTFLVARGCGYREIARRLSIGRETAKWHADNAANKLPGSDMATVCKLTFWYRGATTQQLSGENLKPLGPSEAMIKRADREQAEGLIPQY